MICPVSQGTLYEITIGFFSSAASSVTVPLFTRIASAAVIATCERPSVIVNASCGWASTSGCSSSRSAGVAAGITNRTPGSRCCISAIAAKNVGPISAISERRLPGSTAITGPSAGRPSAMRAPCVSGSSGMSSASGWPT